MLTKKIILQKSHDHYYNLKMQIEQNLLNIKSMESNVNIQNVLMESAKATQSLKLNIAEFENIADKVRDNVENMKEVQDIIGDYNNDILNNEDLENELKELQLSESKKEKEKANIIQEEVGMSKLFPIPNKNNIEFNQKEDVAMKQKENFINNNSFEEILEEMNKK